MSQHNLVLPKMGESIAEATITKWLKKPGDKVDVDESVVEVATDKVDSDVVSPVSGTIQEILYNENDVVPVGAVLAIISTADSVQSAPVEVAPEATITQPIITQPEVISTPPQVLIEATPTPQPIKNEPVSTTIQNPAYLSQFEKSGNKPQPYQSYANATRFYSPLVKSIAKQEHVSVAELETIIGTGEGGRVTKNDVLAYLNIRNGGAPTSTIVSPPTQETPIIPPTPVQAPVVQAPAPQVIAAPTIAPQEQSVVQQTTPTIVPPTFIPPTPIPTPQPIATPTPPVVIPPPVVSTPTPIQQHVVSTPPPVVNTPAPIIPPTPPTTIAQPINEPVTGFISGETEIIEMDRMRRLIAENMQKSLNTSAHVTSFIEVDVTNLVLWRNKVKESYERLLGEKITFTPAFIEAVTKAIKDFPMINISIDGTKIIKKKDINIGMATALPTGNLIVPVIRHTDKMDLIGLTKSVNNLAQRARENKLTPEEIQGGTFTISNIGTFGNIMGTPIINQPQVAILAVGSIKKKPVVLETQYGDLIGIRHMMFMSLSYDHRVVDGFLGGSFLKRIGDYLEQWDANRSM